MLDIAKIPFSSFGSYFVISYYPEEGIYIRDIRNGDVDPGRIFRVVPYCTPENPLPPGNSLGKPIPYHCNLQEHLLEIFDQQGNGLIKFCFADENTLYLSTGPKALISLELLLQKYDHINPLGKNHLGKDCYELHSYSQEVKMLLQVHVGNVSSELPWDRIGNTSAKLWLKHSSELTLESYPVVPQKKGPYLGFEDCRENTRKHYQTYKNTMPQVAAELQSTGDTAAYILFSSAVKPEGILQKYAIYMSNNSMSNIWSWDHAFTSLALCRGQEQMAYEQFLYFKDFQDQSGVFPDFVNNKYSSFSCCKPPIQGYIYQILMRENAYFRQPERLAEVYDMLERLARFWENYRKFGNLYFYNHGNDSGWDNASLFAEGCPVITADLAAHLITLYDTLAEIAALLPQYHRKQGRHLAKAREIARHLVAELWNGERFLAKKFSRKPGDPLYCVDTPHCLLRLLPIITAKYLPKDICAKMIEDLQDPRQFTRYGFATERIDSPLYEAHGYWRGPIWAPSSLLLIVGLQQYGELQLANEAAMRFCKLCHSGGLAENFDARTGEGLDDLAFAWTSSVFLFLAERLKQERVQLS